VSADEQTRFLTELAADLNARKIELPSFPDVVINIRTALEDPTCTAERLADVVRTDPVLAARLLMSANSAFHNRAGIEIVDLNLAISRLGFEVVRNTAITLAVEQIFTASQHESVAALVEEIWKSSLALASMSFVVARGSGRVNPDNAFLCGLLHEVGKLYILTRASDFPGLMGDSESLGRVLADWHASVGKSIVKAWGFSPDIANSLEVEDNLSSDPGSPADLVDVVVTSRVLLAAPDRLAEDDLAVPAAKLGVDGDKVHALQEAWQLHISSLRQSLAG